MAGLLLRHLRIDPAQGGERVERLAFLSKGPVDIQFRSPLTLLVGENGSGKTTLLEAAAVTRRRRTSARARAQRPVPARRAVCRGDGGGRAAAMPATGEWCMADEQSRGEGVLSLLTARVDASEAMLFILDEPESGLSPQRQMALLALLDALHRDGRSQAPSQAIVATHSPILMSHPGADRLWIDGTGVTRRRLQALPHWQDMQRFMADPAAALPRLLEPATDGDPSAAVGRAPTRLPRKPKPPVRLWVLSDLHLEAVPHPEAYRPTRPPFDVLVVAGDVWEGTSGVRWKWSPAWPTANRWCLSWAEPGQGSAGVSRWKARGGDHEPWNSTLQHARQAARDTASADTTPHSGNGTIKVECLA